MLIIIVILNYSVQQKETQCNQSRLKKRFYKTFLREFFTVNLVLKISIEMSK